jgi:integrase/recombinase XerD
MKLALLTEQYITFKQSLGYRFEADGRILRAFEKAQGPRDMARVLPAKVRAFLQGSGPLTSFSSRKLVTLRGFYQFACDRGYVGCSPLPSHWPQPAQTFVPYIYSTAELQRLWGLLEEELSAQSSFSVGTLRTVLFLLYGAGLRVGEALHLTLGDVDLSERILTIRQSKFFKTRLVPLSHDLGEVLHQYARKERLGQGGGVDSLDPFLVTRQGQGVCRQGVERAFRRLCELAQVRRPATERFQPRLHDLRHTFATHRLERWYRQGADVQRLLPQLATYLGHRNLASTQRYLSLTPALLQAASERFAQYALKGEPHE